LEKEQIDQFTHKVPSDVALTNKLTDLIYLYEKLQITLQDQYMDSEDQLQLLAEKAEQATLLDDAIIYIDGFHSFTPQELLVIEALMKKADSITIALTIDDITDCAPSELDLFYQTKETYQALIKIASEAQIPIEEILELDTNDGRLQRNPAFRHLEQHFDVRPAPEYTGEVPIQVAEAVHPRAEVEGAAQEIIRLVRDEH